MELNDVIAGVDEAGRGPLAGPVVAAAVVLPAGFYPSAIGDSKKISPTKREVFYGWIMENAKVGIGVVSHLIIDKINIQQASLQAMSLALKHLPLKPTMVRLDGNQLLPKYNGQQEAIVKGDQTDVAIGAASIVAKVTRDHLLLNLDRIFPVYNFLQHKGYPTPEHYERLRLYGPCLVHRKSFLRKLYQ